MKQIIVLSFLLGFFITSTLTAQPWQQNDEIFNSSGVPSLPFSQTHFADMDADGDQDLTLDNYDSTFYKFSINDKTEAVEKCLLVR